MLGRGVADGVGLVAAAGMGGGGAVATAALVRLATPNTTMARAAGRPPAAPHAGPSTSGPVPAPPGGARHSCRKGYGAERPRSGQHAGSGGPASGYGVPACPPTIASRWSIGCCGGTTTMPATCPGDAPGSAPGRSWSASSCCSRRPVARVREPWRQWIDRWPTPAALAAAPAGEAVRAWGRLGYPRRALRLHRPRGDHRTARRRGADRARRPAGAARRRLLHGGRDRLASPTGNGTSCWTPTSAGCSPGS